MGLSFGTIWNWNSTPGPVIGFLGVGRNGWHSAPCTCWPQSVGSFVKLIQLSCGQNHLQAAICSDSSRTVWRKAEKLPFHVWLCCDLHCVKAGSGVKSQLGTCCSTLIADKDITHWRQFAGRVLQLNKINTVNINPWVGPEICYTPGVVWGWIEGLLHVWHFYLSEMDDLTSMQPRSSECFPWPGCICSLIF